jgi:hypothetical protein
LARDWTVIGVTVVVALVATATSVAFGSWRFLLAR